MKGDNQNLRSVLCADQRVEQDLMVIFYLRISKLENNQLSRKMITFRVKKLLLKVITPESVTTSRSADLAN